MDSNDSKRAAAGPAHDGEGELRRGRVLVVDDEVSVGTALRRVLSAEHDVEVCTRSRAALERILAGERFDAVLCDLMMPELTGIELYERLAAAAPEQAARVVLVTGGAFTPQAQRFLEETALPRIDKPFNVATVRAAVRRLVR